MRGGARAAACQRRGSRGCSRCGRPAPQVVGCSRCGRSAARIEGGRASCAISGIEIPVFSRLVSTEGLCCASLPASVPRLPSFFSKTAGRHEGVEALMLDFRDLTIHFVHLRESREAFSGARLHASRGDGLRSGRSGSCVSHPCQLALRACRAFAPIFVRGTDATSARQEIRPRSTE